MTSHNVSFENEKRDTAGDRKGSIRVVDQQILAKSEEDINFPWARRVSAETIILAYSEGQHTVNEKGRPMVSRDNGKTWDASPHYAVSMTPANMSDGSSMALVNMPDGSSIALGAWLTRPIRGNVHPLTVCRITEDTLDTPEKWQAELELPYNPGSYGLLIHRSVVLMPNGDLIATAYGFSEQRPDTYHCYCIISHDEGKTWGYHSTIVDGESPGCEGFDEPVMLLLKNGDLLCHVRTGGPQMLQVRSKDGGRTWSRYKQIADFGVDPDLIQLTSGAVMTSYGRPGVWLKVDFDGTGEKWDKTVQIYGGPGCSYTSLVELEPGLVALFYTESSFCGANAGFFPINRLMVAYIKIEKTGT